MPNSPDPSPLVAALEAAAARVKGETPATALPDEPRSPALAELARRVRDAR